MVARKAGLVHCARAKSGVDVEIRAEIRAKAARHAQEKPKQIYVRYILAEA
jgi:hypothetical protein